MTIPHANPELRSLNLSTAAGIAAYEALRQIGGFAGPSLNFGVASRLAAPKMARS